MPNIAAPTAAPMIMARLDEVFPPPRLSAFVMVGEPPPTRVGDRVGLDDGLWCGRSVGLVEGAALGAKCGSGVGLTVGLLEGDA